jgi:hypothetical protein
MDCLMARSGLYDIVFRPTNQGEYLVMPLQPESTCPGTGAFPICVVELCAWGGVAVCVAVARVAAYSFPKCIAPVSLPFAHLIGGFSVSHLGFVSARRTGDGPLESPRVLTANTYPALAGGECAHLTVIPLRCLCLAAL